MRKPASFQLGRPSGRPALTRRACLAGWAAGYGALGLTATAAAGADSPFASPRADHHLHIQGPQLSQALAQLKARDPAVVQGVDPAVLKPRTGAEALRLLDAAGIRKGVLLSEAYMFGSPLMAPDNPDVAALTRAENSYNVAEARASGGRLVAFVGVDPLAPSAPAEIDHWAGAAAGVKLHLANSFFDFGDPAHMARLREVFAQARGRRMPIAVHLRNRVQWGAAQADAFIDQVLPAAKGLVVQVAHGAGWGALDQPTVAALEAFGAAIAAKKPGTSALAFDLALVTAPWTKPDDPARFVEAMRKAGIERFLFASDWPAKYTPAQEAAFLQATLPLGAAEWRTILGNEARYLRGRTG